MGTDASGNAYLAGRFQGTATFGSNTLVSAGPADMFVSKYDSEGQVLWARRISTYPAFFWEPFGFAVDTAGNAYLAARASGTADFGSVILSNSAAFLAKYDPAGTLLWAVEALPASAIAAGANGSVYLTARTGILAKYDELGTLAWSRAFPYGQAIAVDRRENIFVTGYGLGTYDGLTITNSGGAADMFVARCSPAGQLLWLRQVGGIQQERGTSIALDGLDNVCVVGASALAYREPSLTFGPTILTNVMNFLAAYDSAGNALWALAPVATNRMAIAGVAVTDPANVYVAGGFSATSGSFGTTPSPSSVSFGSFSLENTAGSMGDLFVAKLAGMEPQGSAPTPAVLAGLRCTNGSPFQFSIFGTPSLTYVVEASTNLVEWSALATNTPPFVFVDQTNTNCPQRFYRALCRP
jgi:hypothetical protein